MAQGKREITAEERKRVMMASAVQILLYAVLFAVQPIYAIYFICIGGFLTLLAAAFYGGNTLLILFNACIGAASLYVIISGIDSSLFVSRMATAIVLIKLIYSMGQFWQITGNKPIKI